MLTGDLALSWRKGQTTGPRYINADDPTWLQMAADLIGIFREHVGERRAELDQELDEYVGSGTGYKILRGLIKLLTDRCVFETGIATDPFEIRRALFLKARARHPVTESAQAREQVIAETADELGCAPAEVIANLYADLSANQKLIAFDEPGAKELLDRYNLAQAQALLYRSVGMQLRVEPQEVQHSRHLFNEIKTYRLIHTIRGSAATGYEVRLSGPVSLFHRSQKYGIQMAAFLPALLNCKGWRMRAEIDIKPGVTAFFELDSRQSKLRSHFLSEEHNENPFAQKLMAKWEAVGGEWRLERAGEIIDLGEGAFIPDFALRHSDGRTVYLEILGFWTPRYLADRLKEFAHWGGKNFLLAVSDELRGSREPLASPPENVIVFKSTLEARAVRDALEQVAPIV
ncbi:MAG TPA: DUF790 family protein [Blastocatellia bacterium]|nr:DUF790 family protein [Blastocatellia bacterium]